jgi:hypothetical protein
MFNLHRAMQIGRIVVALAASLPCAALAQQFYPAGGGGSALAVGSPVTGGSSGCVMFDNSSGNLGCDNGIIYSGAGGAIGFSSSVDLIWNSDTALSRLGAGSLMLSHGTSATKSTVSATTDSLTSRTNYADAYLQAGINSGEFDLGSEHGGTATTLTKFGLYADGTLEADWNKTSAGNWTFQGGIINVPGSSAEINLNSGSALFTTTTSGPDGIGGMHVLTTDGVLWWSIQVGAGSLRTTLTQFANGELQIGNPAGNGGGLSLAFLDLNGIFYSAAGTALPTCNSGIMLIRLRPTHTSCRTYAIYPVVSHNVPCHIKGTGKQETAMPFKHQAQSYRNRNGIRYECAEDVCDGSKGDLRWQAQEMVRGFKDQSRKAFFEKGDGYYRVFVEADADKEAMEDFNYVGSRHHY